MKKCMGHQFRNNFPKIKNSKVQSQNVEHATTFTLGSKLVYNSNTVYDGLW